MNALWMDEIVRAALLPVRKEESLQEKKEKVHFPPCSQMFCSFLTCFPSRHTLVSNEMKVE